MIEQFFIFVITYCGKTKNFSYFFLNFSPLVSVQQKEEWWDGIMKKYGDLSEKYDNTMAAAFARAMCVACVNELERMYRIQTGNMESVFGGNDEQVRMQ